MMTDPIPTGPHCRARRRFWLSAAVAVTCGTAPWLLPLPYAIPVWLVAVAAGGVHVRAHLHLSRHA